MNHLPRYFLGFLEFSNGKKLDFQSVPMIPWNEKIMLVFPYNQTYLENGVDDCFKALKHFNDFYLVNMQYSISVYTKRYGYLIQQFYHPFPDSNARFGESTFANCFIIYHPEKLLEVYRAKDVPEFSGKVSSGMTITQFVD